MAAGSMYGREMTWGALDVLARYYDVSYLPKNWSTIADYNYKDKNVKPLIDNTKQGLTLLKAMNHLNDIDFDEIEKELKPISKENNEIFENML